MNLNKIQGIELLKFLAAIMITNSHCKPLYPDSISALGTFGAPGNALFFLVSGFTLMLGRKDIFSTWYKRRISRIWPSVLAWSALLYPLLFGIYKPITFEKIWLGGDYWFLHCIVVYYAIYWFIDNFARGILKKIVIWAILIETVIFFFMPIHNLSIYQTDYHYICFFSVMIMGAYIAKNRESILSTNLIKEFSLSFISLILFYAIQAIGKGKDDWHFYVQIISLIPLHSFLYYLYVITTNDHIERIVKLPVIGIIIRFIAALTLEIYLVGFVFILTDFNNLFPLNLLIVFGIIVSMAYAVKIISNFILQTLQDKPYDWKKIVVII